mmetsp:Transcript_20225/g.24780  ORF Transcript_20225/g.24780 Transcript_20225/m.24780 type:complete len:80 (-) Transcript_20225:93-332(-)
MMTKVSADWNTWHCTPSPSPTKSHRNWAAAKNDKKEGIDMYYDKGDTQSSDFFGLSIMSTQQTYNVSKLSNLQYVGFFE